MKPHDLQDLAVRNWIHSPKVYNLPNPSSEGVLGGGVVGGEARRKQPRFTQLFWAKAVFVVGAAGLGGVVLVAIFF
jgi:hypothetical protein